jgi:addiction module HigA family antidote
MSTNQHPGKRIREEVIPAALSVTAAAQLLGVGRPALSNLLNGRSSLSPDMAARLATAFGVTQARLMDMQAQYDAAKAKDATPPAGAIPYIPPFLSFKANDIEQWASENIGARTRLSVLLRTLVHSTDASLTRVDFPGNDDAERPGWDGWTESASGSPWVPLGPTGWEFGVTADVKAKADHDFDKSVKATEARDRARTTFVFVTPRRWPGKTTWLKAKQAKPLWRQVLAYDASDLEQWVEQSLPAQAWLANELRRPSEGVRSLDACWHDWANVTNPPLAGSLFRSAIEAGRRVMKARLAAPSTTPIVITADSTEEALAYLAQLFSEAGGDELFQYRDRVLAFDTPGTLPRLAEGTKQFISVAFTREVERELAPYVHSTPCIVIYPRNATNSTPDIALEPASSETLRLALEEMGKSRSEIEHLEDASGRSLTILRRQLATVEALRRPPWAAEPVTARTLVPLMLAGTWSTTNAADRMAIEQLAGGRAYEDIERDCQLLAERNDAPVWAIGTQRGVVSKLDLLYAVATSVTAEDLKRYFTVARRTLGEDDPSLDLPEEDRWLANLRGKTREFSSGLRRGISETLVLLATQGPHLFKTRLGLDIEGQVNSIVSDLLGEAPTTRTFQSHDRDLSTYAEAAPETFLTILERDLRTEAPATLGLLKPVDSSNMFGSPSRTGLLWALEGLAWNPVTLPRVASILAKLATVEIKDNWGNKPINSLLSIFRSWMPQTAAPLDERVAILKSMARKFPEVAWKICVTQFASFNDVGDYTHKPRWRPDGFGFGEPHPTRGPTYDFVREMVEMALTWQGYSQPMLCDLVERIHNLAPEHQTAVWKLIQAWSTTATDNEKAVVREKIRVSSLSQRAARRAKRAEHQTNLVPNAKAAYDALEPADVINRNAWLFTSAWVDETAEELENIEDMDYHLREERVARLRASAMHEVHAQLGLKGLLDLATAGGASGAVGWISASEILQPAELIELVQMAYEAARRSASDAPQLRSLISSALWAMANEAERESVLLKASHGWTVEDTVGLLIMAPFSRSTWSLLEALDKAATKAYWERVKPDWIPNANEDNSEAVRLLLWARRPRAAFYYVHYHLKDIEPLQIQRILEAIVDSPERNGEYRLDQYYLDEAFKLLNASGALTLEQMAHLEIPYLEALKHYGGPSPGYAAPNLNRYLEAHPELYFQAVAWTYKRDDDGVEPPELNADPELLARQAVLGHRILDAMARIPGHNDIGVLETGRLSKWIGTVLEKCRELSRGKIGGFVIGKMLSASEIGQDGIWPCEVVRDVLEELHSENMVHGVSIGAYNARGVHWRGEGGDQERELAKKYRSWENSLRITHPFVASELLGAMAKSYERDAKSQDIDSSIRKRLR